LTPVVAAKPCWPSPSPSPSPVTQERKSFVLPREKEAHEKATHETRGNNDTTLFASSIFSSLAILNKAISPHLRHCPQNHLSPVSTWYLRRLTHSNSPLTNPPPSPPLTHHHRLASLYTSGLRGSLQISSIYLSLDCLIFPFFEIPEVLRTSAIL
jgi:hypothetical protein